MQLISHRTILRGGKSAGWFGDALTGQVVSCRLPTAGARVFCSLLYDRASRVKSPSCVTSLNQPCIV